MPSLQPGAAGVFQPGLATVASLCQLSGKMYYLSSLQQGRLSAPMPAEHSGSGPKLYAEEQIGLPFSLAQLVVFSLVARSGSCRAAATALSMSQPGVSKSLASLEKVRSGLPAFSNI